MIQVQPVRDACLHYRRPSVNAVFRTDPTRTLGIQARFVREVNVRFRRLKGDIRKSIVDNDCFGLTDRLIVVGIAARPRQFAFPRSSDKIRAFMDWLNEQEEAGILEVVTRPGRAISIEEAWTDKYILSAYQKAMIHARANLRKQGIDVPSFEQVPGGVMSYVLNQPMHADRLGLLFTRTFNELKGIDDAMDQAISRVLTQGMAEGRSPVQLARWINKRVDNVGRTRARMLARTEVIRTHAEATLTEMELAGVEDVTADVEFTSAGFNVCPQCSALVGRVFTIKEARGVIPIHPNCLVEDSRVSAEGIAATSKRRYDGDIVVISTAGGKQLACTPNHPVLTRHGWMPARMLNVRDNVVCSTRSDSRIAESGDDENVPATIKEIADAFGRSPEVLSREVPVSSPDFHGDGKASDVAIVWAYGELLDEMDTSFFQHVAERNFVSGDIDEFLLHDPCSFAQFTHGCFPAPCCLVCGGDLSLSLRFAETTPFDSSSIAPVPGRYAVSHQNAVDRGSGDSETFTKSVGGHAISEERAYSGIRQTVSSFSSRIESHFDKDSLDDFVRNFAGSRDFADSPAGKIFFDEIITVERKLVVNVHVYNLQTRSGFYSAEGIITQNCRCSWLPANVGEDRREARKRAQEQKRENVAWWKNELEKEKNKRRPDRAKIARIERTISQLRETL